MQLILMKSTLTPRMTNPNDMPSPSASPSVWPIPVPSSQDTSKIVSEFNQHMFEKAYSKASKTKLKEKTASKLVAATVAKASQSINSNKKTAIHYSTKYIFCLISENDRSLTYKEVYRQMKAKGYEVGKGSCLGEWAKKGSHYWFKLLQEKGDGAKYVLCISEHLCFVGTSPHIINLSVQT